MSEKKIRLFTVGELCGLMRCEMEGCHHWTDTIVLTNEENDSLPEKYGPNAVKYIFDNHIGVVMCDGCLRKFTEAP